MSEPRDPPTQPAGDGELLSAYLDGELDQQSAAALEARLADDPALAEQLERLREVVESLATLHTAVPGGFADRLRNRLEAERTVPALEPAARRRAAARQRRWGALGAVAAAAVAVAVLGGLAVNTGLRGGQDAEIASGPAEDRDLTMEAEQEDGERARTFADAGGEEAAGDEAAEGQAEEQTEATDGAGGEPLPAAVPGEPVVVEAGTTLAGDAEARDYFAAQGEARGLLGLPAEEAEQLGAAFVVALRHAEEFSNGLRPDRCLDELGSGEGLHWIPVRVERVTYAGEEALAYLVASATTAEGPIDRVAGWIIEPEACGTRLYSPVNPEP